VLGNEENMADTFATHYLTQNMRDRAPDIILARARSWMFEDSEVDPATYDHKGEHELDIRRAYRTLCLFYGADPAENKKAIAFADFSEHDLADCSDIAPEQIEDWDRVLAPFLRTASDPLATIQILFGEGPMKDAMKSSALLAEIATIAGNFAWPNGGITLHFDHCDRGASWSRSERRILLCDDYVARFIRQGDAIDRQGPDRGSTN
jgi:hypothetical protein